MMERKKGEFTVEADRVINNLNENKLINEGHEVLKAADGVLGMAFLHKKPGYHPSLLTDRSSRTSCRSRSMLGLFVSEDHDTSRYCRLSSPPVHY